MSQLRTPQGLSTPKRRWREDLVQIDSERLAGQKVCYERGALHPETASRWHTSLYVPTAHREMPLCAALPCLVLEPRSAGHNRLDCCGGRSRVNIRRPKAPPATIVRRLVLQHPPREYCEQAPRGTTPFLTCRPMCRQRVTGPKCTPACRSRRQPRMRSECELHAAGHFLLPLWQCAHELLLGDAAGTDR
eukprot:scaffold58454_cov31-Tisochrysis_lutea.AAC.2